MTLAPNDVALLWDRAAAGGHVGRLAGEEFSGLIADALSAHTQALAGDLGVSAEPLTQGRGR